MKALTLHGVHAFAVCRLGKDIENRSWFPSDGILGQRIAIHAGAAPGHPIAVARTQARARELGIPWPDPLPRSAIVATVTLAGYVHMDEDDVGRVEACHYGPLTEPQAELAHESPWFIGDFGWVLRDLHVLASPIPCSGAQGLWEVPAAIVRALQLQSPQAGARP